MNVYAVMHSSIATHMFRQNDGSYKIIKNNLKINKNNDNCEQNLNISCVIIARFVFLLRES